MKPEERKRLILEKLEELSKQAKVGGYVIVTEKNTNKYIQISMITGEEKVLLEVPEAQLSKDEVAKISNILREVPCEEEYIGLQMKVDKEAAVELIERIFREGLGLPEDYEITVEIS
ncbi:MAG: hypothetical protein ACTSX9_06575 [Candidatus Njordarchaeales archaeon]